MKPATDLSRLLSPRAIAVVGATNKPGRIGRIIFEQLLQTDIPVFPVHPTEKAVLDRPAVPAIESVPIPVDVAIIAVAAEPAVRMAESCAARGVKHLIIVAGGFAEAGPDGKELEKRLQSIPVRYGTRILGPNTLGLFLPHNKMDTIFVEHGDQALAGDGGVALISQSGSVGVEALGLASNTGFGMRAFVGLGNKCDLDELDFLQHFARDRQCTCLAFYIETFDQGRRFLEQAQEVSRTKPVVVLKAGRSEAGASAVSSHTGRLAGSDQVVGGAFRQFGVQRVFDDEELCDAAKTLAALPPSRGSRVAILTPAGGYGVMGADHVDHQRCGIRLSMAELTPATSERIRSATVPFASVRNPVDLTASATDDMMGKALDALVDDPGVDIIICTAFFSPPGLTDEMVDVISERINRSQKPIIVFTRHGPFTDRHLLRFHRRGVVGFPSIGRAVRAARFLVERAAIIDAIGAGHDA